MKGISLRMRCYCVLVSVAVGLVSVAVLSARAGGRADLDWRGAQAADGVTPPADAPGWCLGGVGQGGSASDQGWHADGRAGDSLLVWLDRREHYDDTILEVEPAADAGASLFVDFADANGSTLLRDAVGDLLADACIGGVCRVLLPLSDWPDAELLVLRPEGGTVTVRRTTLYVDLDGDGLDAVREEEFGTSDRNPDSDGDGTPDAVDATPAATAYQTGAAVPGGRGELSIGEWRRRWGLAQQPDEGTVAMLLLGGEVIYVDLAASGLDDGTSWQDAFSTLTEAIAAASPGDEIWVAAGTYIEAAQMTLTSAKNGVGVYGGFAGTETERAQRDWRANETILDGNNVRRVFYCNGVDRTLVIDGFTIRNGRSGTHGAGMYVNSSSGPYMRNCVWRTNDTGGFYNGGGAYVQYGATVFHDCEFFDNVAGNCGGAVAYWRPHSSGIQGQVINCVFGNNSAAYGAAGIVFNSGARADWVNCLFLPGPSSGGYIRVDNHGPLLFANCTFTHSTGYSIYLWRGLMSNVTAVNTIFSGTVYPGGNLSYCRTPTTYPGTGNITDAPQFADSADPDGPDGIYGTADDGYQLAETSPCRDTGCAAALPPDTQDLDGDGNTTEHLPLDLADAPRIDGDAPDMGCFEFQSGPVDSDGDGMPDDWETQYSLDPDDPDDAADDNDSDGLTNLEEFSAGTDPTDADTDNDVMPDGFEVAYSLDPLADDGAADADSDGVSNLVEFLQGRSPQAGAVADTTGLVSLQVWTPLE